MLIVTAEVLALGTMHDVSASRQLFILLICSCSSAHFGVNRRRGGVALNSTVMFEHFLFKQFYTPAFYTFRNVRGFYRPNRTVEHKTGAKRA